MQLAGKTPSPAASIYTVQRPMTRLLTGFLLASAVLAGCSTHTPAPITDIHSSTPSTSAQTSVGNYTVQPGDTLYKIAQQHGTTVQAIADANNITDPAQLRVGQTLAVQGAGAGTAVAAVSTPKKTTPAPQPITPATAPKEEAKPVEEEPTSPVATDSPRASDAGVINWGWPASGTIIQGFTASTKGIDIKGDIGDPVVAAANGKVMYAGNGVRGLGNLILLGHSDGFITAYAHNDSLLVKTGQEVTKGEKVATLGQSDTTSPRLHFEVRRRGTPVNPMSYLPSR